jgi:hypothetical protein
VNAVKPGARAVLGAPLLVVAASLVAACGRLLGFDGDDAPPDAVDGGSASSEDVRVAEGSSGGASAESGPGLAVGLRVFVTSKSFSVADVGANLDGLCTAQLPAGVTGNFRPWLSTSTRAARDDIKGDGPWRSMDGKLVAANRAALLGAMLANPIDVDENGKQRGAVTNVWTGTTAAGVVGDNCNDWQRDNQDSILGTTSRTDGRWTELAVASCTSATNPVYCFESE